MPSESLIKRLSMGSDYFGMLYMRGQKVREWEKKLKSIFDEIDKDLEEKYSDEFRIRPGRPSAGGTANPESDGLFNIGAVFSAGYGSEHGRGYIVRVHMATSADVPDAIREEIERDVVERLNVRLPQVFEGRDLHVERDGNVFKIVGDFGL